MISERERQKLVRHWPRHSESYKGNPVPQLRKGLHLVTSFEEAWIITTRLGRGFQE